MTDPFFQALMIPVVAFILCLLLVAVDRLFVASGYGTCERCHRRDAAYVHPDGGPGGVCRRCVDEV